MEKDPINELEKRIENYRGRNHATVPKPLSSGAMAFNIAVELVAGVIVGVIIGVFLDKIFDSKPTFLIICLLLSFVAAFRLIWQKYVKK